MEDRLFTGLWALVLFIFTMAFILYMPSFIADSQPLTSFTILFLFAINVLVLLRLYSLG